MKTFTNSIRSVLLLLLLSGSTLVFAQGPPGFCPTAQISYTGSPYCSNAGIASVTLTGSAGGKFYAVSDVIILDPRSGDVDLGASTPGTYQVFYTLDSIDICPAFTTSTSITINTGAFATINYPYSPYCSNTGYAKVVLLGDAGGTYSGDPGLVIDPVTGLVNTTSSAAGTFTVYYTVSNACGSYTATTVITIVTAPDAGISYDNSPYCSNAGYAEVTLNGTSGGSFYSDPAVAIDPTSGEINLSASTPGTYTVYYTVSASNCTTTATATVTITGAPSALISYDASPYCTNGGLAYVTITGTPGGVFSAPAGLTLDAATGTVDPSSSTAGTYTVTYSIASNAGCGDFATSVDITIVAAPTASFSYPNSTYCSGSGIATVSFTGTTGGTFSSSNGIMVDPNSGTVDLSASTPGTYTVYYILTGTPCGDLHTSADIMITPAPSATISYSGSPYCSASGIASVTLTGDAGGTFTSDPRLVFDASSGDVDLGASTPGTYDVTYTVSSNGCSFSTVTSITIVAAPNASIVYTGDPYNTGGGIATVTLTGDAGGTYSSDPGLSIDGNTGDVDLSLCSPGTYTVTYTITPSGPCSVFTTTTTITISGSIIIKPKVQPELTVFPNPVVGNTLGLQVKNLEAGTYILSLYNNIGQQVYSTQVMFTDGKLTTTVSLQGLQQGIYELRLTGRNHQSVSQRISIK